MSSELTQKELKERLNYNPDTGVFTWLRYPHCKTVGKRAGCLHSNGYRWIGITPYKIFREHRLAWFYMTGQWPKDQIDHINRVKDDNRWSNLREANSSQQQANTNAPIRSNTGIKGVKKTKAGNYIAIMYRNKKPIFLGTYKTIKEAQIAYQTAKKNHFGEFYSPPPIS